LRRRGVEPLGDRNGDVAWSFPGSDGESLTGIIGDAAVTRTFGHRVAATLTRAIRTDEQRVAWDLAPMTTHRKRKALDLFFDALLHPVRFR
jgi:hypothetical protein